MELKDMRNEYRKSGVMAGLIGGLLVGLLTMIVSAAQGEGFFTPLHLIASLVFRDSALAGGIGVVLVGLLIHLVFSGAVGLGFSRFAENRESVERSLASALLYSVIVWVVMTVAVTPWAVPRLHAYAMANKGWWIVDCILFGASLALTPVFFRAMWRRREFSSEYTISRAA